MNRTLIVMTAALAIGGAFAASSCKNQGGKAASAKAEAEAGQRAEAEAKRRAEDERAQAQAQKETALVRGLIGNHEDFAVCRIKELKVYTTCGIPSARCPVLTYDDPHFVPGSSPSGYLSDLLVATGYLYPFQRESSGMAIIYYHALTDKGLKAIGNEIKQERVPDWNFYDYIKYQYVDHDGYKWTLVLACRELQQIDATMQLSDGLKVDFSWRWKNTDLGVAAGLDNMRHRSVAYFTRTANGLAMEPLKLE